MATADFYMGVAFDTTNLVGIKNQVQIEHADGLLIDKLTEFTSAGGIEVASRLFVSANSAADNSALILGSGTDGTPATTAVASKNFLEFRGESTATGAGSDTRVAYLRLYLAGATTGGGEALRAYTTVEANIGTARGAHISLDFLATAGASECSGLGAAVGGTLHIPNVASWAPTGTLTAGNFEIYSDGAASDPAGLTRLSVLRLCNSGNATGKGDVDTDACLFDISGWTAAAEVAKVISSTSLTELPPNSIGLRIYKDSVMYYIPAVISTEWN